MTDTLRDKMQALRKKLETTHFTQLSTHETNATIALLVDCLIGLLPNPIQATQSGALEQKPPGKPAAAPVAAVPKT